jgi:Chlorophyll A-B binding protein
MVAFVPGIVSVGARAAFSGSAVCAKAASKAAVSMAMSKSVPFLEKPARLDGLAANFEFDPLGISNYVDPKFLAEAEIKHGRICMVGLDFPPRL